MARILTTLLLFLSLAQAIKAQTIVIDSAFEMVLLPQEAIKKNKIERIDIAQSFTTKNGNINSASITNSFNRKGRLECSKFRQGGFEKDSCIEKTGQYQWETMVRFIKDENVKATFGNYVYETNNGYKIRRRSGSVDTSLTLTEYFEIVGCITLKEAVYIVDNNDRLISIQDSVHKNGWCGEYSVKYTYTEENIVPTEVVVNDRQYYTIEQQSDSALVVHKFSKLSDFAAKQHTEGVAPLPDYKEIKTIYIDIKRSNGLPAEIEVRHETIQRDYQQKPPLIHQEQWKYTYR